MKIKVGQQEHFNKIVKEVNNDRYSAECVNYAVRWANLIETEMLTTVIGSLLLKMQLMKRTKY